MKKYTIVALHHCGLTWLLHVEAENPNQASELFCQRNEGTLLVKYEGHLTNVVKANFFPTSDGMEYPKGDPHRETR